MKKWIVVFLSFCMLLGIAACGAEKTENIPMPENKSEEPAANVETTPVTEAGAEKPEDSSTNQSGSKILIAYFTWAENTQVENPEEVDVDATSSASVLLPGNTAKMAGWIQQKVGGDLFSIVVSEPYSSDYDECLDRAADEKAENARPELVNHVDNMEDYDVVFLGFPNWWYTAPMAIFSFIEEYDFSGKTVVPFCAHGTGGLAGSVTDITAALPDSTEVLEPIGVYRPDIDSAQPVINEWLEGLGFEEREADIEVENTERKLKMTVNGQEVAITLYDTPAANALYDMLPLDLNFEDFNGIEKISYLSQELPTEGEPDGCDPDVGDLCLYAPWGNLSIFYQDFRYSDSLIMLGHIDSGMDVISEMEENTSIVLEKAN